MLATRLTSGQCVLLHYFRDAQGGTAFYVFDWTGTELPPRSALDALDIKPSKDLWKFHLSFPRVPAADAPTFEAEIARKWVAMGVSRKSTRAASPCSIVHWEELEAYLLKAYNW